MNLYLPNQLIAMHTTLENDRIPYAFGGAVALAYSGEPRATYDLDINILLKTDQRNRVLNSLSTLFPIADRAEVEREIEQIAQARMHWGPIPVDLFFSEHPFHESLASRVRIVNFVGTMIPVLSAEDLVLCKSAYNRPKDWIDIENVFQIQRDRLDQVYLRRWLNEFFPPDDERRLRIDTYIRDYIVPPTS